MHVLQFLAEVEKKWGELTQEASAEASWWLHELTTREQVPTPSEWNAMVVCSVYLVTI